jgi:hypothetical protein
MIHGHVMARYMHAALHAYLMGLVSTTTHSSRLLVGWIFSSNNRVHVASLNSGSGFEDTDTTHYNSNYTCLNCYAVQLKLINILCYLFLFLMFIYCLNSVNLFFFVT